jgi:hypothetical protein
LEVEVARVVERAVWGGGSGEVGEKRWLGGAGAAGFEAVEEVDKDAGLVLVV